jgi:hypothetical protein
MYSGKIAVPPGGGGLRKIFVQRQIIVTSICITRRLRVRVRFAGRGDSRGLQMRVCVRKTVSGCVIHNIFCADFCGYLLNKS